jgi:hypothetical protein
MAGHRVELVSQVNMADQIGRSRYDVILAERFDALAIPDLASAGFVKPSIIGVLEDPSAVELAAARQQLDAVLKTPQPPVEILKLLDDVMKTRLDHSRRQAPSGG